MKDEVRVNVSNERLVQENLVALYVICQVSTAIQLKTVIFEVTTDKIV